jgi:hypothetical protein
MILNRLRSLLGLAFDDSYIPVLNEIINLKKTNLYYPKKITINVILVLIIPLVSS